MKQSEPCLIATHACVHTDTGRAGDLARQTRRTLAEDGGGARALIDGRQFPDGAQYARGWRYQLMTYMSGCTRFARVALAY